MRKIKEGCVINLKAPCFEKKQEASGCWELIFLELSGEKCGSRVQKVAYRGIRTYRRPKDRNRDCPLTLSQEQGQR